MDFKIVYRNKEEKNINSNDNRFPSLIKDGMENNTFLYIQAENEKDTISVEFGDKCCNIQMDNEEMGEIYGYLNLKESEELVDLWANCYPKNMLCYNTEHLLKIIRTFIQTGKPDSDFEWDIRDM